MSSFGFFLDAALAQPASNIPAALAQSGSTDVPLWFGSISAAKKVQDNATPGGVNISVQPYDPNAGTGQPVGALKLAATQGGLAGATSGAALDLGVVTVLSGVGNAMPFWLRATDIAGVDDATLQLRTNELIESAQ